LDNGDEDWLKSLHEYENHWDMALSNQTIFLATSPRIYLKASDPICWNIDLEATIEKGIGFHPQALDIYGPLFWMFTSIICGLIPFINYENKNTLRRLFFFQFFGVFVFGTGLMILKCLFVFFRSSENNSFLSGLRYVIETQCIGDEKIKSAFLDFFSGFKSIFHIQRIFYGLIGALFLLPTVSQIINLGKFAKDLQEKPDLVKRKDKFRV
jgi:asparagine N-glycosylation enzyme membrane subunit Stt3